MNSSCSSLSAAMVDSRDLLALLALLLPLAAHKELAEIAVWLAVPQQHQGGNSQGVSLRELDAAARELLTARELMPPLRDALMIVNHASLTTPLATNLMLTPIAWNHSAVLPSWQLAGRL